MLRCDLENREGMVRIVARLSHQGEESPDNAELVRIRLKCDDKPN